MTWPTKTDFSDGDVLNAAQMNNIGTNLNEADPTGITDGYVLTADGAGGMGWEAVASSGGYSVIASGTLSGSSFVLSSIPATYKHLYFVCDTITVDATNSWYLRFNGFTSSSYRRQVVSGSTVVLTPSAVGWQVDNGFWTSGFTMNLDAWFPHYSVSRFQNCEFYSRSRRSDAAGHMFGHGQYAGGAYVLNSIQLDSSSGATLTGGTYTLYGVS